MTKLCGQQGRADGSGLLHKGVLCFAILCKSDEKWRNYDMARFNCCHLRFEHAT